jgi:ATP-dependent helicase HrpB
MTPLPIEGILPDLRAALARHARAVLSADPGAGKTTRVPLALLDESWLAGKKILMLEPRRLAAQRAASYMSQQIGEPVGGTVGYRIRGEQRVGRRTRVEVVTEGILARMLQDDPALDGTGLVIFDEFHERSIHADLGLALALDAQEQVRDDIRILVMSATLDGLAVSALLGDAPVLRSEGRMYPVATHYLPRPVEGPVEQSAVAAVFRSLRADEGDVLVFLPGQREIRRTDALLGQAGLPPGVTVHLLYGEAPPERQKAALTPAGPGARKVILATSVAETSLTIDGVRVVIDAGLARSARFDPRRGMSGLVTTPVSRAAADQRRGRAGRQGPGVCYRLWTEQEQRLLQEFAPPEITVADLAPLLLDLAQWGAPGGEGLKFLDPPPPAHLAQARELLTRLGAIDAAGKLTAHGRAMSRLPVHPRYAHMLIRGKELGRGALACDVAALLEERDLLRGGSDNDIDLASRWHALRTGRATDRGARERATAQSARLRELIDARQGSDAGGHLGMLLAMAYPERVAKRRTPDGVRYQLAGGPGGVLPPKSALSREEYLAVGDVDGVGAEVRIFLAEPVSEADLRSAFGELLETSREVAWDPRQEIVVAREQTRLGAITLDERPLAPGADALTDCMIEGIRQIGLGALPWTPAASALRERSEWLRRRGLAGPEWPDLSDEALLRELPAWLGPYLAGITRRTQLSRLDLQKIVEARFSFQEMRELDRLVPTHLVVPTGSRIALEYPPEGPPVLAVRLQEMFGQTETPTVAGGKVKVLIHLLSPARRPLAVTQDLPSFWKNAYADVRKDMRGRYPKHHWPENPLEAEPTRRTKRRS